MLIDLTGMKFDQLVVVGRAPGGTASAKWICKCSCGRSSMRSGQTLRRRDGSHSHQCDHCTDRRAWKHGLTGTVEHQMWSHAKLRAKRDGVPFAIKVTDILIPERCPILGIRLVRGKGHPLPCSPSLDRIVPALGYVVGNVAVISHRANRLKGNMPLSTLLAICKWVESSMAGSASPSPAEAPPFALPKPCRLAGKLWVAAVDVLVRARSCSLARREPRGLGRPSPRRCLGIAAGKRRAWRGIASGSERSEEPWGFAARVPRGDEGCLAEGQAGQAGEPPPSEAKAACSTDGIPPLQQRDCPRRRRIG